MSGGNTLKLMRNIGVAGVLFASNVPVYANDNPGTPMTAGAVVEKLSADEFFLYVSGMIEGLAYARFLKDSAAAGEKSQDGMVCMQDWYLKTPANIVKADATFRKYADYPPAVVIAAMIKKECGE